MAAEIEVLFEWQGSKKAISCSTATLCDSIALHLQQLYGHSSVKVYFSSRYNKEDIDLASNRNSYLLQRFSTKWKTFIDAEEADMCDGDRVTVVHTPQGNSTEIQVK